MEQLKPLLEKLVDQREVAWGCQLCIVDHHEVVVDHAVGVDGLRRPLSADSTVAMYCAAKSLAVVAAGQLVTAGELSFEDHVGDLLDDCSPPVAALTVEDLLSHRSGLARPSMIEAITLPPEKRLIRALRRSARPPLSSVHSRYSESAAWLVLAACLAAAANQPYDTYIHEHVLARLKLEHDFELDDAPSTRRRVAISLRDGKHCPLLLEESPQMGYASNPGYGGFATMQGLALLHATVAAAAAGEYSNDSGLAPEIAARLIEPGALLWDETFQRACSFSRGFMTVLASHHFCDGWSDRAFAQSGLSGMTTIVSDPVSARTVAIHLNGMIGAPIALDLRHKLWSAVNNPAPSGPVDSTPTTL